MIQPSRHNVELHVANALLCCRSMRVHACAYTYTQVTSLAEDRRDQTKQKNKDKRRKNKNTLLRDLLAMTLNKTSAVRSSVRKAVSI